MFYEHSAQAVVDTMDLAQRMVLQTVYHISQAQMETNLAKRTVQILSSSSTRSELYVYTWWDWIFRALAVPSYLSSHCSRAATSDASSDHYGH